MTTRKHDEFLNIDDDEDQGFDSEESEERKGCRVDGLISRSKKRPRHSAGTFFQEDDDDGKDSDDDMDENDDGGVAKKDFKHSNRIVSAVNKATSSLGKRTSGKIIPTASKPVTSTQLAASQRAARKSGVVYLSRIPPFMRPQTVRRLLAPHGAITRLFLTPEAPASYASRTSSGGNKKRSFVDGWVEFSDKRDAKICAEALNGKIVGGKKGGWYHDDLWNIKYLRGFKWGDLMAQVREEERERGERLRLEVRRVGKERKAFLENVEKAKVQRGKQEKKRMREEKEQITEKANKTVVADGPEPIDGIKRRAIQWTFKQSEIKTKSVKAHKQPDEVKRVLSKIF